MRYAKIRSRHARKANSPLKAFILATILLLSLIAILSSLPTARVKAAGPTTFTNSANIAINDNAVATPYPSNINVAIAGTVTAVTVTLNNLSIGRPDDLDMLLVGPTGINLKFLSDAGGFTAVTNVSPTFSDAGAAAIPDGSGMATGTFQVSSYGAGDVFPGPAPAVSANTTFSAFNGSDPNGTWSLYVLDDGSGGATGNIAGGWSITVTTASAAATTTTLGSNNNPSFTTAPNNSVTLTATVTSSSTVNEGTVNFTDNAVTISGCGAVAVVSGSAQCITTFATEGDHPLVANYNGTANFGNSNGSLTQRVDNHTVVNPGNEFCNTGAITITDGGGPTAGTPYPSNIFVSGLAGTITQVVVDVNNFSAPRGNDVDFLLVSPSGAKLVLMSDAGGASVAAANANLVFDDAAPGLIANSGAIASGTFKPTNYGTGDTFPAPAPAGPYLDPPTAGAATLASAFNGGTPNGTWSLYVVDDGAGGGNGGIAGGWCVTITTSASAAATTTALGSNLNPSFTGPLNNTVTLTATVSSTSTVSEGTVNFTDNAVTISGCGAVAVVSGTAQCTTTFGTEGNHPLTAAYSGTINFGSSSGSLSQEVNNHTIVSSQSGQGGSANIFTNSLSALTINDSGSGSPYPSRIFVNGVFPSVVRVQVTLTNLTHARPDDLDVLLVGPNGTNIVLMSDVGGGTGSTPVNNVTLVFNDSATASLPDSTQIVSGDYDPTNVGAGDALPAPAPASSGNTALSVYNGIDPNGTWSLYVADDTASAGAGGSIGSWTLTFFFPTAADGLVSGHITTPEGNPIPGTVVNLSGTQSRKTITDANGYYQFSGVETTGFYSITPTRANYNFTPGARSFSQLGERTEAAFTGSFGGEAANPLDTAEYFVRQQYVDLLGREPDEGGFNYWSDRILECAGNAACVTARRRDVAAAFFIEQEFQLTGSFIYGLYKGGLGRRPLYAEFSGDRQQVAEGPNLETMKQAFAESFVGRAEFVSRYQLHTTGDSFVDALINNLRQASGVDLSTQRSAMLERYAAGTSVNQSRSFVLREVADAAAFKQAEYNSAFVLTEYFGYLRRDPDQGGYDFWLNVLNNREPGNFRGMVCAFITSAEYQLRFSSIVSHNDQECGQ